MGYMTVVSILNDAWPTIKEHPDQFIKNIGEGMENYNGKAVNAYPVSNYANPMEVHRSFHANLNRVLVVGGNHMEDVSELQPGRVNDEFYLAYKMRTAVLARDMANSALLEIQDEFAKFVVNEMKAAGLTVDDVSDYIQRYDTFKAMDENDQKVTILKVGIKFAK